MLPRPAAMDAQTGYQLLDTLGTWLPFVVIALFAGGVSLAGDRRRTLLRGALGVAGAMVVVGVLLTAARVWYVDATPADVLTAEAAGSVFDTSVRFLRTALRALGVLAVVLALAALVTGPSAGATRARAAVVRGIGSLRGGAEAAGLDTGRFGSWLHRNRTGARVAVLIAGGLVLMSWDRPTGGVVVGLTVGVLVVLALVELLARPPEGQAPAPAPVPGDAAGPRTG